MQFYTKRNLFGKKKKNLAGFCYLKCQNVTLYCGLSDGIIIRH